MAFVWNIGTLIIAGIVYNWERDEAIGKFSNWVEAFLFWIVIVLIISIPIALIIGYFTKTPKNKIGIFVISSLVFILMSVSFNWFFSKICQLGDTGTRCPQLTESPITLITSVITGLILGLLGGYGYWRAGRHS